MGDLLLAAPSAHRPSAPGDAARDDDGDDSHRSGPLHGIGRQHAGRSRSTAGDGLLAAWLSVLPVATVQTTQGRCPDRWGGHLGISDRCCAGAPTRARERDSAHRRRRRDGARQPRIVGGGRLCRAGGHPPRRRPHAGGDGDRHHTPSRAGRAGS